MATRAQTYRLKVDGGLFSMEISNRRDITVFSNTLQRLNGTNPWGLSLTAVPEGKTVDDMSEATEYLQAGGSAAAMTLQIRKPGGETWGCAWVRYTVGHVHEAAPPLDVPVGLADITEMVSQAEVFAADEAAEIFWNYYQTGDNPAEYSLRPVQGWTSDQSIVDLRRQTA